MALLLTLLVTVILAVVILEFNYLMRVHASLANNLVDDLRAETAARGGIETAKAILMNDIAGLKENEAQTDTLSEEWAEEIEGDVSGSTFTVRISDEMGKINLNRLIERPETEFDIEKLNASLVENLKRLFEFLEFDQNLVDALVDWLDENSEEQPFGAENAYYESLSPPVACKNGPLDSIDELLFIKGFDEKIVYGDDENPGISEFVTVLGDKDGLININTAGEPVVAAVLNNESLASVIMDMRESDPFESPQDLAARLPDVALSDRFTTRSSCFLIRSTGVAATDVESPRKVTIQALIRRSQAANQLSPDDYLGIQTVSWKTAR